MDPAFLVAQFLFGSLGETLFVDVLDAAGARTWTAPSGFVLPPGLRPVPVLP